MLHICFIVNNDSVGLVLGGPHTCQVHVNRIWTRVVSKSCNLFIRIIFSQTKESIAEGQRIDMQLSRGLFAVLLLAVVHCGQAELVLKLLNQTLVNSSGARW